MMISIARKCLPWMLVLAVSSTAWAQAFPFLGIVNGDDVNARAGGGANYYAVARLDNGSAVYVVNILYDWYEIKPPAGQFSYIAKEFVKAAPDGKTGVVTGDKVRVRAPSPAGPGPKSYRVQAKLDTGAVVNILGEQDDYYKIEPPKEAVIYVKKDFIRPATDAEIAAEKARLETLARARAEAEAKAAANANQTNTTTTNNANTTTADTTTKSTDNTNTTNTNAANTNTNTNTTTTPPNTATNTHTTDTPPTTTTTPPADPNKTATDTQLANDLKTAQSEPIEFDPNTPKRYTPIYARGAGTGTVVEVLPENEQLQALEKRVMAFNFVPLRKQPLKALQADYEKLLLSGVLNESDRSIVQTRLKQVERYVKVQDLLLDVDKAKQAIKDHKEAIERLEPPKTDEYVAVGLLKASALYTGEKLPLLFRLVDPSTDFTSAYLRPTSDHKLSLLVGRYIGVKGKKQYDSALKRIIIDVQGVDELFPAKR